MKSAAWRRSAWRSSPRDGRGAWSCWPVSLNWRVRLKVFAQDDDGLVVLLDEAPGIENIASSSVPGISQINITFNLDKKIDVAFNEVQAKVSQVVRRLPKDADPAYALCFSVPVGAKGLHTVCRDHYTVEGSRADERSSLRWRSTSAAPPSSGSTQTAR